MPLSPVRGFLARLAAAAILVGGFVASAGAQSTEPRPVYDASSWADVMGELRPYWNAFKSEQQANGITWNDTGQITSIEGGRLVSATRSDAVPQAAIPRIVALAKEAGVLVADSPGGAAQLRVEEAERARNAADEASVGGGDGPFGTGGDGDEGGGDSGASEEDDGSEDGSEDGDPAEGEGEEGEEGDDSDGDGEEDGEGADEAEDGEGGEDPGPVDPDDDELGTTSDGPDGETDDGDVGEDDSEDIPDLDEGIDLEGGETGETFKDIAYGTQHARQVLDIYLPAGDGPFPVVVFFHGGAFVGGDKSQASGFMTLVEAGYALVPANYKLLNKSSFGDVDFLNDVGEIAKAAYDARAVVRWVKDNGGDYKLDGSRIAAVGASAGGYLAAAVGACGNDSSIRDESASSNTSAAVRATVDWFGPTDFATFMQDSGQELPTGGFDVSLDMIRSVLNGKGAVSPVEFVDGGDPPHMVRHGEADTVVPVGQSESYAAALRQAGVSVDFETWPAQGHGAPSNVEDEIGLIIDFLDSNL